MVNGTQQRHGQDVDENDARENAARGNGGARSALFDEACRAPTRQRQFPKPGLRQKLVEPRQQAHLCRKTARRRLMTIHLDHTIVPARDKEGSARFFARIFGLEYSGPVSHFAPVKINDQLTIDFDDLGPVRTPPLCLQGQRTRIRRHLRPGQGRGSRLRQRPPFGGGHGDQPSPWRARVLFPRPEWSPARSADRLTESTKPASFVGCAMAPLDR